MKRVRSTVLSILFVMASCTSTIEKAEVPVSSIILSRNSAELVEGESITLTATVSPSDATDKSISWSSSKSSVASVDQKGTVNALSVGTAVITATAGGKNNSCTVTVISKTTEVSSITLNKTSLSLKIGEEYQLNATINPNNASEKNVSWSSASSSIATVKDGLVKGVSAGETEITASCGGEKAVCKVKISPIEVESITLSKTELDVFVGDSETITATIKPEDASDQQITWSSSDSRIATVSKGIITGVKEGNVTITAKAGSKTAECKVVVKNKGVPVSSVTLNKTTLFMIVGGMEVLTAKVLPYDATEQDVKWSSSNTSVVTVSNGTVSAKSLGTATITATAGGVSTNCMVEVVNENDSRVDYLCFDILAGGDISVYYPKNGVFEYSKDLGKNWITVNEKNYTYFDHKKVYYVKLKCSSGDKVMLRGTWKSQQYDETSFGEGMFANSTITANISGNLLSIIKQESFWESNADQFPLEGSASSLNNYAFSGVKVVSAKNLILPTNRPILTGMFKDCIYLQEAPSLPSTNLTRRSYQNMFAGCSSLKKAPQLPATVLFEYCYSGMFSGCISLESAPSLPSTKMADYCYSYMFSGCSSLTKAPELPATILADACYTGMFSNCKALKEAPSLPAMSMVFKEGKSGSSGYEGNYTSMFKNCTSLEVAPDLPAMKLAKYCYDNMFMGCSSLTTAPNLPATSLEGNCYHEMFYGCSKLSSAPTLPATTLKDNCYAGMFRDCSSLESAPSLPAINLATGCYSSLFYGCSSLTTAPDLPAQYLVEGCYSFMFKNCSKLNYVKAMFVIADNNCLKEWLIGTVRPSYGNDQPGTFVKNKNAFWTTASAANIPNGWKLIDSE